MARPLTIRKEVQMMNKRKTKRQRQEQPNDNRQQNQQPENMEFGEEFTFDQRRQQPNDMEYKERRNNRK